MWSAPNQIFTSRDTSCNSKKIPYPLKKLLSLNILKKGHKVLDFGAGKYNNTENLLVGNGITYFAYDPFNREYKENLNSFLNCSDNSCDFVFLINLLNVIPDLANQKLALVRSKSCLKSNGIAVVKIYEGNMLGEGKITKKGFQHNKKNELYVPLLLSIFPKVEKKYNVFFCKLA